MDAAQLGETSENVCSSINNPSAKLKLRKSFILIADLNSQTRFVLNVILNRHVVMTWY